MLVVGWLCLILINIDNGLQAFFFTLFLSFVRCLSGELIVGGQNRLSRLLEAQHSHPYGRAAELALS